MGSAPRRGCSSTLVERCTRHAGTVAGCERESVEGEGGWQQKGGLKGGRKGGGAGRRTHKFSETGRKAWGWELHVLQCICLPSVRAERVSALVSSRLRACRHGPFRREALPSGGQVLFACCHLLAQAAASARSTEMRSRWQMQLQHCRDRMLPDADGDGVPDYMDDGRGDAKDAKDPDGKPYALPPARAPPRNSFPRICRPCRPHPIITPTLALGKCKGSEDCGNGRYCCCYGEAQDDHTCDPCAECCADKNDVSGRGCPDRCSCAREGVDGRD